MGAAAVPLVLSLGGAAAQYIASERANSQRQAGINSMADTAAKYGAQNRDLTTNLATQYDPAARKTTLDSLAGTREGRLTAALNQGDAAFPVNKVAGPTSAALTTKTAASGAAEAQRRVDVTRLLSKVLAPTDLQTKEGFNTANTAAQQSTIATNMRGRLGAQQADVSMIRPDPLLTLGGAAATGVGSGLMASNYYDKLNKIYAGLFPGGAGGNVAGGALQPDV